MARDPTLPNGHDATRAAGGHLAPMSYRLAAPLRPWRPCARTRANFRGNCRQPGLMIIWGDCSPQFRATHRRRRNTAGRRANGAATSGVRWSAGVFCGNPVEGFLARCAWLTVVDESP